MSTEDENDEVFDEEEIGEGFSEEELEEDAEDLPESDEESGDEVVDEDDEVALEEAPAAVEIVSLDEDDIVDDADVEMALDEVLAETIMRTAATDEDEDAPVEVDPNVESTETPLPKQDDEFRCKSCRLLKKVSQLADSSRQLCRDCV